MRDDDSQWFSQERERHRSVIVLAHTRLDSEVRASWF